jgi:hypothetical protein
LAVHLIVFPLAVIPVAGLPLKHAAPALLVLCELARVPPFGGEQSAFAMPHITLEVTCTTAQTHK